MEMRLLFSLIVKECAASSPTAYFWYRKALDITDSIDETGEFNYIITGCLLAAWVIVCLGMYKGIKSTGKVFVVHVLKVNVHMMFIVCCNLIIDHINWCRLCVGDVFLLRVSVRGAAVFPDQRRDARRGVRGH